VEISRKHGYFAATQSREIYVALKNTSYKIFNCHSRYYIT